MATDTSATRKEWAKKSYYEVLDVPKDATSGQIKKAYYKMARVYHPDQSDDPAAEEIFKAVNEAYHVLIDEEKRATYDRYGKEGVAQSEGGMMDPVDVMKSMFGGDSFEDTFGELNMWEMMRMQFMGSEMTEEEVHARLESFATERHSKLVAALAEKLTGFVTQDIASFKQVIDADVETKVAAPGGVTLLGVVGYIYCQVAQQFQGKFFGSVFAKLGEKGHKFSNNMSALGAAVSLTYNSVKLQQKMEMEQRARQEKWIREHPEEAKKLYYAQTGVTAETYPYEHDPEWQAYERNVEVPAGVDREAALTKIKHKWFDQHIALHEMPDFGEDMDEEGGMTEERMKEDKDAMKVFDQGLKLMWKLGVMEAEEVVREVCRSLCDPKSDYNKNQAKPTKEVLKRRVQAIHHIGEKYKAVAARLQKGKKGGFSVQDFLDEEAKKSEGRPNGPEDEPKKQPSANNDNNAAATAPSEPEPEPEVSTAAPATATDDVD